MNDYLGPDLISDLPQSIIESILIHLPIREAVKTSILSRKWRYKWATINQLVFDEKSVDDFHDGEGDKFITSVLLLHHGPIHKFQTKSLFLPGIDKWFLFLSRTDIKELILEFHPNCSSVQSIPSCLFNCKKLTHLELQYCVLDPHPPLTFKGFLYLKSLILHDVLIEEEALARLISSCPLLESLLLNYIVGLAVFHIRAPNLKCLYVEGNFLDICLEDTPLLVEASLERYWDDDDDDDFLYMDYLQSQLLSSNFMKSLDSLPNLERLIAKGCFTHYLKLCNYWSTLPTTYFLKIIELNEVNFADLEEILVVLRLITNSPNLQQLRFRIIGGDDDLDTFDLDLKECYSECTLKHLKIVKLECIRFTPLEKEFIKFLFGSCPVLESMTITTDLSRERKGKMLIKMEKFPKASARARIYMSKNRDSLW